LKPKMLLTIFLILLILSFMPIYPNPKKKKGRFQPFVKSRVNLWKALS